MKNALRLCDLVEKYIGHRSIDESIEVHDIRNAIADVRDDNRPGAVVRQGSAAADLWDQHARNEIEKSTTPKKKGRAA